MIRTQVLIAGAGPVGLTLAIELGRRGVQVLVADKRPCFGKLPKMERCNARTMESFRRMGIADEIREAGLDNDMPMDVFICLENVVNAPLVQHHYASVNELRAEYRATTDGSTAAEPYQLISQYTLEPLLRDVALRHPGVSIEFDREVVSFAQDADGVTAVLRSADGLEHSITADYLVGCDGASSTVRDALGFELEGDSLLEMRQALFFSEELLDRIPIGPGRHYHVADDVNSFLIVQDDKKHFSLHATVGSDEEMAPLFERIVGFPIAYEQLYVGGWRQRLMLADHYRDRRVFLAGDSAHLVIPTGGLGMNTGHGDAVDLGWKLAATLAGWAGPELLDSYEAERRPVGARNIAASRKAAGGRRTWRSLWRASIADDTAEGRAVREELSRVADREQRWSNDLYGIELGYRYLASPVLLHGSPEEEEPQDLEFAYTPSTGIGFRVPNTWLPDGRSIQDVIGTEYALIADEEAAGTGLAASFAALGVPFRVVVPATDEARAVYGAELLLVRPDLHIAWRGLSLPPSPDRLDALARLVTGNGTPDDHVAAIGLVDDAALSRAGGPAPR